MGQKLRFSWVLGLLLPCPLAAARAQADSIRPLIAFTHVNVVDGTEAAPRSDQTVVLQGNRIIIVGPTSNIPVPNGTRIIPAEGRYLVPGFWDMHVHTVVPGGREVLPLFVANGVLGVRDMAGDWTVLTRWRREIAAGQLVGPRILASGPYIEGGDVPIAHFLARTPEEARAAVDSLVRLSVDVIKLHSQLSPEVYFAAARAAREKGMRIAGHVPRSITVEQASDSGVGSIEHMLQIPLPCTPAESVALVPKFPVQRVLGQCSSRDLAPLFARLVQNGTWVVPTLVAAYEIALWPRRELPGDAFAGYLPDTLKKYVAEIFPMPPDVPADADQVGRELFRKRMALVGTMHHAGVGVLPGTDMPLRNSPPGFGLHEELALLVQGGLTPFEALRAATLEPARYFGMLDSLGSVVAGKVADLVLLNANPLDDIHNTRKVEAVVANGRFYDAPSLAALLHSR
jgi:imidazolonepropionase-like amidohydrolase